MIQGMGWGCNDAEWSHFGWKLERDGVIFDALLRCLRLREIVLMDYFRRSSLHDVSY